ncbi:hypothetical protein EMCG_08474 [[Emmonsia] crescens]|uniref:Uncharacterized protein n=1 Tax=[Emmonsia] crescens TaxID=73230 RepID=A0A0G2I655_9EURO|nr:hypothetical protein EMCG_08474 [Emmonsia crescens UAMH 3008]
MWQRSRHRRRLSITTLIPVHSLTCRQLCIMMRPRNLRPCTLIHKVLHHYQNTRPSSLHTQIIIQGMQQISNAT